MDGTVLLLLIGWTETALVGSFLVLWFLSVFSTCRQQTRLVPRRVMVVLKLGDTPMGTDCPAD